ncbi:MAG TPA: hypothetical protein VJS12_14600 [Steroidobacteraceae bacterium]|nr:hypothetical protein [Steroidobacteraceae bacterium]
MNTTMNATVYWRSRAACFALSALLGTALAGCDRQTADRAGAVTQSNVAQKIEQARTPTDHRELAEYYESRASVARREAVDERELRGEYERRWGSGGNAMRGRAMHHFDDLAEDHQETETHYRAMAEWHREMARNGDNSSTAGE